MRRRLLALLSRLHLLPALTEQGDIVVVIGGEAHVIASLAARVAPDGDVIVVDPSVDRLEELRLASAEPDVTYLVGEPEVLPLPDGSVDGLWLAAAPPAAAAPELFRVLRAGGTVSIRGSGDPALNMGERMLSEAGFVEVAAADIDGGASLTARKP